MEVVVVKLVGIVGDGTTGKGVVVVRLVDGTPGSISDEGGARLLEEGVVGGEDEPSLGDTAIQC